MNLRRIIKSLLIILSYSVLNACSYKIEKDHYHADIDEGFMHTFVYTELVENGKPVKGSGKLVLCPGYSGLVSDTMRNAAILGGAALLGTSFPHNGTSIQNQNSQDQGQNQTTNNSVSQHIQNSVKDVHPDVLIPYHYEPPPASPTHENSVSPHSW